MWGRRDFPPPHNSPYGNTRAIVTSHRGNRARLSPLCANPPPGSAAVEHIYADWFASQGLAVTPAILTNGSDYASFWSILDKPFGFLHTGTGAAQDPCYHQACDTIDNPDRDTLATNARAAAHVLATLDARGTELIPKKKVDARALGVMQKRGLVPDLLQLEELEALGERHLLGCGHEI